MYKGKWDVQFVYNDYELLYLATLQDEEAINIILQKYEKLIYKYNQKFDVNPNSYDDYFQEGRLVILKAIKTFDVTSKKSFTKYLELLLYHRYVDLARKNNTTSYELMEDETIDFLNSNSEDVGKIKEQIIIDYEGFSKFEHQVYQQRFEQNLKPKVIAQELNVPINKVYSAIDRVKGKIKNNN